MAGVKAKSENKNRCPYKGKVAAKFWHLGYAGIVSFEKARYDHIDELSNQRMFNLILDESIKIRLKNNIHYEWKKINYWYYLRSIQILKKDIAIWLSENNVIYKFPVKTKLGKYISFLEEKDAVHFKLRWL